MRHTLLTRLAIFVALFSFTGANAQEERLYMDEAVLTPGDTEPMLLTIGIENCAHEDYTAFQFNIELPEGLELAYDKRGRARVATNTGDESLLDDHTIATKIDGNLIKLRCYSSNNYTLWGTTGALIDIYVVPTAYLKPGDVTIRLHEVLFARANATAGYEADLLELTGATAEASSTLDLKVSAASKFSTAILPFDVAEIPEGLEAYSCSSTNGENLVLGKQQSMTAYTPYILYAANGFDGTLSGNVDASKYPAAGTVTEGYLTGAVTAKSIGSGNGHYVMQNKGDGPMFYRIDDAEFAIPAGKCWLTIPAGMQNAVSFRLDGTTDIGEVKGENVNVETYDLQGRKIENPTKGLYIIDGNKTIIK